MTGLSPVSSVTVVRPSNISAKVSGGPNDSDHFASAGDTSISSTTPKVPAMNEPIAAMPSAGPARPCSAIWWPSRQVTTDADSPGVLISTDVIVPPYIVPAYSAASMMIPEVGFMPNVSGSNSATPEGGPTPGSAPIRMPSVTPAAAINRLKGVSATEKPRARLPRKSMISFGIASVPVQKPSTLTGIGTFSQRVKTR